MAGYNRLVTVFVKLHKLGLLLCWVPLKADFRGERGQRGVFVDFFGGWGEGVILMKGWGGGGG